MAATQEKCDVVDSWEDIDENEILEKAFPKKPEPSVKTMNGPLVIQGEDSLRTQYTPPEPSVKILKRPTRENRDDCTSNEVLSMANGEVRNSRQPVRTLQQRQIDYAEARLRILGEAKSPEDEFDDSYANCKSEVMNVEENDFKEIWFMWNDHVCVGCQVRLLQLNTCEDVWELLVVTCDDLLGLAVPNESEKLNKMNLNSTGVTLLRPCDVVNIVRHPRGPDGTKGFNFKR